MGRSAERGYAQPQLETPTENPLAHNPRSIARSSQPTNAYPAGYRLRGIFVSTRRGPHATRPDCDAWYFRFRVELRTACDSPAAAVVTRRDGCGRVLSRTACPESILGGILAVPCGCHPVAEYAHNRPWLQLRTAPIPACMQAMRMHSTGRGGFLRGNRPLATIGTRVCVRVVRMPPDCAHAARKSCVSPLVRIYPLSDCRQTVFGAANWQHFGLTR